MAHDSRQGGAEIEVTHAMIEAGVEALREMQFGQPLADIVREIYWAMAIEQDATVRAVQPRQ